MTEQSGSVFDVDQESVLEQCVEQQNDTRPYHDDESFIKYIDGFVTDIAENIAIIQRTMVQYRQLHLSHASRIQQLENLVSVIGAGNPNFEEYMKEVSRQIEEKKKNTKFETDDED